MLRDMLQVAGTVDGDSFDEFENEGGRCPTCNHRVELWTCSECGMSAWVIDCAHRRPGWLRRGRQDGSARGRIFCGECADVLPERPLPA
jgi:hypothetical protein